MNKHGYKKLKQEALVKIKTEQNALEVKHLNITIMRLNRKIKEVK